MADIYFTITGTKFRFGDEFFKKKMKVELVKEPDNKYDKEAIKVMLDGLHVGYVANSAHTVLGECMSAGRIYDKIGDKAHGKVKLVTEKGIVCKLCKKSLLGVETIISNSKEEKEND